MGKYYILECYGPEDEDRASLGDIIDEPDVSWNLGRVIREPISQPLEVHLNPDEPGLMMPMFERNVLLMQDSLVRALTNRGIDNIDLYDAVVVDPSNGRRYFDYKAVNILGLISAADMEQSIYTAHGKPLIDVDFEKLVIDEVRARDIMLFRLAECVSAKVIHERVRDAIERAGIPHLDFVRPEDWQG